MFVAIFVFKIIAIHIAITATEILSNIHVCGRNDPNYNQCIADNIIMVKDKICNGFPEFDLPSAEPLLFDKTVIFDTPNVKLYAIDTKVRGICDFVLNSVHTSRNKLQLNFNYTYKQLYVNTTYDFNVRLLIPLTHRGILYVITDNVEMRASLDLKVIIKNGMRHIYASNATVNAKIKDFEYKFDDSEKGLVQLHTIFNIVIDYNKQIVINTVEPVLEEKMSKLIIQLFNNITESNYEKYFPEQI